MENQTIPITRTVVSTQYPKNQITAVTLNGATWTVGVDPGVRLGTQLPDIRVMKPTEDVVFAQVVINLFLFNKLDARRVILDGERELVYMVKSGETVVIPPLPDFKRVWWVFTLGGTHNKDPLLRFTFDHVSNVPSTRKRKRVWENIWPNTK